MTGGSFRSGLCKLIRKHLRCHDIPALQVSTWNFRRSAPPISDQLDPVHHRRAISLRQLQLAAYISGRDNIRLVNRQRV